ncbi:MAG: FliI/YscN family ATPase [Lentisphaerales bacterium]|nr:FliI/YscN family ATPase [Lentisphaerales bacterium]
MLQSKSILSRNCKRIVDNIKESDFSLNVGRVTRVTGLLIESTGPNVSFGDQVYIHDDVKGERHIAEVVGFDGDRIMLTPVDHLNSVRPGARVTPCNEGFRVKVSRALLGRVIDGMGRPLDGKGPITGVDMSVLRTAPDPFSRPRINEKFLTGVKAIDSCITCGKGQRVGIFAGSGVGKSTMLGMISRNCLAQVNVIALIGERGKEVLDFIEESLGEEGLANSIVVCVTSDQTALHRVRGADTAMAIAEYFRDEGDDVLFVMDSVTRYAMAQREIGLSAGEPPTTKGYPPSVFSMLPKLLERPGRSSKGSITAFITVLVEGDDMNDIIGDTVRSIIDGHIVLSRKIASRGRYPSIDVLESVSRVIKDVTDQEHLQANIGIRRLMATYREAEDMINIGAYVKGSNPNIDRAIQQNPSIEEFLGQGIHDKTSWEEVYANLLELSY